MLTCRHTWFCSFIPQIIPFYKIYHQDIFCTHYLTSSIRTTPTGATTALTWIIAVASNSSPCPHFCKSAVYFLYNGQIILSFPWFSTTRKLSVQRPKVTKPHELSLSLVPGTTAVGCLVSSPIQQWMYTSGTLHVLSLCLDYSRRNICTVSLVLI